MRLERAAQPDGIRGSDGRQSLRQDLAVTAMAAEDVVLDIEEERATDRGGLLTDREMSRSAMVVGHAAICAVAFEQIEHRLELAHQEHVAEHPAEAIVTETAALVLDRRRVRVERNRRGPKLAARPHRARIDNESLRHGRARVAELASRRDRTAWRVGGSAPARSQVSAAAVDAKRNTSRQSSSSSSSSARRLSPPRSAAPTSRPAVNASPAPTVSTTRLGIAGDVMLESRVYSWLPFAPSVTTTATGPVAARTSAAGSNDSSAARSRALTFMTSHEPSSSRMRSR